jgi:DsbC/DsbD-like thiol-disulfide interchange protein
MLSRLCNIVANLAASLVIFGATAAFSLESPWVSTSNAEVRLLAAGPSSSGSPIRAGLQIRLARGWHTYWRYPGDAGVPPRLDWSASTNVADVQVRWPAPERILLEGGLGSIGYHGDIILPLQVRPQDPARSVSLRVKLDFGVCEKICIPAEAKTALDIPAGFAVKNALLDTADARVPVAAALGKTKTLGIVSVKLERHATPRALIEVAVPRGKTFDLFAEGPTDDWALPLPTRIEAGNGRARFTLPIEGAPTGAKPIPSKLRLTLVAGDEAIEVLTPLD